MYPILFYIGSWPIYSYGAMVALGFLAVVFYMSYAAKRQGLPSNLVSDLSFWVIIAGIIGARVAYLIANWDYYLANPDKILGFEQGGIRGLIFYGGLIGGFLAVVIYSSLKKQPLFALGDLIMSGLPLGHAFGRVGCFLNGCCYGSPWPHGCFIDNEYRYPTQLFEAAYNLLLFGFLAWFYTKTGQAKKPGRVVALYLIIYPIGRFLLEFLRGDERLHFLNLTVAQVISLVLFITGLILWFSLQGKRHANPNPA